MNVLHHPLVVSQAWMSAAVSLAALGLLREPLPVIVGAVAALGIVLAWAIWRDRNGRRAVP